MTGRAGYLRKEGSKKCLPHCQKAEPFPEVTTLDQWQPRPVGEAAQPKHLGASSLSKTALGLHSPANEAQARRMVQQALLLSRQAGTLGEAADMMEEALNKWPVLREQYEYQLKLWRRGIVM